MEASGFSLGKGACVGCWINRFRFTWNKTVDIEKRIDIPAKRIERYVKQLKDAGIIEFKGANRTGGYYLIEKAEGEINK